MAACPRCGYSNDEVGDFCANPDCRADLRPRPGAGAQGAAPPSRAWAPERATSTHGVPSPVTAPYPTPLGGPPSYPSDPRGAAPTPALAPDEAQRRRVRITAEHTELSVEPGAATVTSDGAPPPVLLSGVRRQLPRFPWWVPTAALALVGILIAVYALLPADTVPTVSGQVREAAVATLEGAGYRAVEIAQPNDEGVAAGTAIRTEPGGGAELPDGERVRLFVSLGPCDDACPVTVPDVDGLPVEEARQHLAAAQFVVARVNEQQNPAVPAGAVISTAPPGGAEAEPGSEIVITASAGAAPTAQPTDAGGPGEELTVPDVVGTPAGDAVREIEALGLVAAQERIRSNEAPRDQVVSTEPAAVAAGDTVALTLAEPTAPIDLLAAARDAEWSDGGGELTFGSERDGRGSAVRLDAAGLEDGSIATVLQTRPDPDGSVTGEFTLPGPIIPVDHLRASVGLTDAAPAEVIFVVRAGGEELARMPVTADGELDVLDVDLSPAAGASAVEITVRAGEPAGDRAAWKDLRIEGQVG